MEQILTADEVIEMLEKHVLTTQADRDEFRSLLSDYKLLITEITNPDKQIPLLEKCAGFLRSKGIFVYFKVKKEKFGKTWAAFVVGELGLIFSRLSEHRQTLKTLLDFLVEEWDMLPPCFKLKLWRIELCVKKIGNYFLPFNSLKASYINSDKKKLKVYCHIGWRLVEKVEAFMETLKDLKTYYAFKKVI
jgi:hypothetical protein